MSKTLITFLSIIPGLGLWVLGHRKAAVFSFVTFVVSVWGALSIDSEPISNLAIDISLIIWVTQFFSSLYSNRVKKELDLGVGEQPSLRSKSHTAIAVPPTIKYFSRGMYKSVQANLKPGEILELVVGNPTHFVAISDKRLILARRDIYGKPSILYPFIFEDIKAISLKLGFLNDILIFDFGRIGDASFSIPRGFRRETNKIVDRIMLNNTSVIKL